MALKQDEDFLRYLTMGAAGTAAVIDVLNGGHGHRAVELERYATANKLWATKIKRLRLPDLFCLECGARVEVRAKSALAIRMSHSESTGRQWDAGLGDHDLVAFVAWDRDIGAASSFPQFFEIGAMRATVDDAKLGPRKSASEGAERDLTWPARVPKRDGTVVDVNRSSSTATYQPHEGRRHTYRLAAGVPVHFYAEENQALHGGKEFLIGCVAAPRSVTCSGSKWDWSSDLDSRSDIDRYAAVKAAGLHDDTSRTTQRRLVEIAEDGGEDKRIRLEARGSLARIDPERHVPKLADTASRDTDGEPSSMALAMESIFILSEIRGPVAADALVHLAGDRQLDSEARCAAVWGLGDAGLDAAANVLPFIADPDDDVALHALAAIGQLEDDELVTLRAMLSGTDREAASAASLLAEDGDAGLRHLLDAATGDNRSALWAQAALGKVPPEDLSEATGGTLPTEIEDILSPMWTAHASWLDSQNFESPLGFLRRQRIRCLP